MVSIILGVFLNQTNLTIFAPTNNALDAFFKNIDLTNVLFHPLVFALLEYHAIPELLYTDNVTLKTYQPHKTLLEPFVVYIRSINGSTNVNSATIQDADQIYKTAGGGWNVVHGIDQVLLPIFVPLQRQAVQLNIQIVQFASIVSYVIPDLLEFD